MKYQAFLSHNSADKPAVEELGHRLEQVGISTFLDTWHLIPGEPCQPALEQALAESKTCVVFIGPSGLGPWQNAEMQIAISRRVADSSGSFRVIPVILPGVQRPPRSKLPSFLSLGIWVEFSRDTLDDEDAFHHLRCGILGIARGPGPGKAVYEGECPYRGLQVFETGDARFFFGRDADVDWLLERLAADFGDVKDENRFLGVAGASGSGKSSLVRAGLIPALQTGRSRNGKGIPGSTEWAIVDLRPGSEPLKTLADALWGNETTRRAIPDPLAFADQLLADPRRLHGTIGTALHGRALECRFVIVVDQFEEIFTQFEARFAECDGDAGKREKLEAERQAFIDNLLYAATVRGGRGLVIITIRADFYGKCSPYTKLCHALSDSQNLVAALQEEGLRAAIEQPAQLCGLELEQGLVDILLQDMRQQPPGALPLLQQTLFLLWQHRNGRRLTVQAYRDMGGIEGALEAHAEEIYEHKLRNDEQRDICHRIMLMLTTPGEETEDTRRRIPRSQLGQSKSVEEVLQELAQGRLITLSDTHPPQVEVAHEALIRGWGRLRQWLDADRDSLRALHQLLDAAETWDRRDRDPSYLYTGSRLLRAEEWGQAHSEYLKHLPLVKEFISRSVEKKEFDARRMRRRIRVLLAVAVGAASASILAAVFAGWAISARATAVAAQKKAEDAQAGTEKQLTRAEWLLYANQISSAERALDAGNMRRAEELLNATRWDFRGWEYRHLMSRLPTTLTGHSGNVNSVAFSPDGEQIVSGSDDDTVKVWNATTGHEMLTLAGHSGRVNSVGFSPDGKRIVSGSDDETVTVWDATNGQEIFTVAGYPGSVRSVAFSPDGKRIVSGGDHNTISAWDAATGRDTIRQDTITMLDATTGLELLTLNGHSDGVSNVAFSPDGKRIVSGSNDKTVKIWNANNGQEVLTLKGHSGPVLSVAFSPDGKRIVSGSDDKTVKVWDAASGQEMLTLGGHSDGVSSVAFSPDGRRIITGGYDNTMRVWDTTTGQEMFTLSGHSDYFSNVSFSPDGKRIISCGGDDTVKVWNATTGHEMLTLSGHSGPVWSVGFSPDGKRIVSGSDDKTVKVWDAATRREMLTFTGHSEPVCSVSFSPDGKQVVSADHHAVNVWDAANGQVTLEAVSGSGPIWSVSFSPDGKRIVGAAFDRTVKVWDTTSGGNLIWVTITGQEIRIFTGESLSFTGHADSVSSLAFSPDGTRIVSGSNDKTVKIWNATNGQEVLTLYGHSAPVSSVAFSPDGERMVSGSEDKTVKVWGTISSDTLTLAGHSDSVLSVAFSPDGKRIVSGSVDLLPDQGGGRFSHIIVWDATTGQETLRLTGNSDGGVRVGFSPDGKRIVSGSCGPGGDGLCSQITVWDATTGQEVPARDEDRQTLRGEHNSDTSGKRIVTAEGPKLMIKDADSGKILFSAADEGEVLSPRFSPDGRRVVSGCSDGTVKVWLQAARSASAASQ